MERTAMQILIQHMKDYPQFGWYDKATELLAIERYNIVKAWDDSSANKGCYPDEQIPNGTNYFTQKYGDGSK